MEEQLQIDLSTININERNWISNFKFLKSGTLYCLHDELNGFCRIGITNSSSDKRQRDQAHYYPFPLTIYNIPVSSTYHSERFYHNYFADRRRTGDWFHITPKEFLDLEPVYTGVFEAGYNKLPKSKYAHLTKGTVYDSMDDLSEDARVVAYICSSCTKEYKTEEQIIDHVMQCPLKRKNNRRYFTIYEED